MEVEDKEEEEGVDTEEEAEVAKEGGKMLKRIQGKRQRKRQRLR